MLVLQAEVCGGPHEEVEEQEEHKEEEEGSGSLQQAVLHDAAAELASLLLAGIPAPAPIIAPAPTPAPAPASSNPLAQVRDVMCASIMHSLLKCRWPVHIC
jgi:hypothetical protein